MKVFVFIMCNTNILFFDLLGGGGASILLLTYILILLWFLDPPPPFSFVLLPFYVFMKPNVSTFSASIDITRW